MKERKMSSPFPLKRAPIIYKGKEYKSIAKLSRELQVDYKKLTKLLKEGLTPEEAIEKINTKKYSFNGKYYANKREIAEELGISVRTYEQSDLYKNLRNEISPTHRPFTFRNVQYESKDAFYQTLGISGSGVRKYAIRHGISTDAALEEIANKKFGGSLI